MIQIADLCFYSLIVLIGSTTRFQIEDIEHHDRILREGKFPIYAAWHDRIFLGAYVLRGQGLVFITSQSLDGEYISRFLQRLGFGVIRGSSTRGGAKAMVEMIRVMKQNKTMGFTIDGPRGPRYVVKPGAALLAKKTGNPILPFIIEPAKYIAIGSWDRLQMPRPWSKAKIIYGKPIYVAPDAGDEELAQKLAELQAALDGLVERGKSWREAL